MAIKKKAVKTKTAKKTKKIDALNDFNKKFHQTAGELSALIDKTKSKISGIDKKHHKKIMAGLAGASVLLAGIIGYKKMKKK